MAPLKRNRTLISSPVLETLAKGSLHSPARHPSPSIEPQPLQLPSSELPPLLLPPPTLPRMFSRLTQQPSITTFCGKSSESVEDFLDEVHHAFTHIADAYTEQKDKEISHLHLIKSHCDGRAKKFIRSLPERREAKAADLIAALGSAFGSVAEKKAEKCELTEQ